MELRSMRNSSLTRAAAVFAGSLAFLLTLAPSAPFSKELGVFESSAVRDILAGHAVLPSYALYEPGSDIQAPPLSWWIDAAMVRLLGWNEIAFRLPEIVAAATTCAILFFWLAQVATYRAGFWAAAALLFCHFFADAARQPRMDAMLTMFATASIISLERALCGAPNRRRQRLLLAAILMALGTMTKGVLGVLLPGLVIGAYCAATGRWRRLFALDLIAAFAGAVLFVTPWYVAAYHVGGQRFLQWQIYGVLFHRFLSADIRGHLYCPNPFYYFVPITLAGFFPWSFYLPALGVWLWRRRGALPAPAVFSLCWFAAVFLFFSASKGKCFVYILPAFPGLAAGLGLLIDRMYGPSPDPFVARTFEAGSGVLGIGALLVAAAMVAALIFGPPAGLLAHLHRADREYLLIFSALAGRPAFALFLLAWIAGGVLLVLGLRRRLPRLQLDGVLILAAAGTAFWLGAMNPALSRHQSLKSFAAEVDAIVPAGAAIDFISPMDYDLAFYSSHAVGHAENFDCRAAGSEQRYLVISQEQDAQIDPARLECLRLIAKSTAVDHHGERLLFVLEKARAEGARSITLAGSPFAGAEVDFGPERCPDSCAYSLWGP
jgi:4-amino-4-deoxy-L-arabinose transferase-like glycosyltransferase